MSHYRIRLAKESFKFSATHFTLFSAVDAERLHGHNYQVTIECELTALGPLGMGFEFNSLKPIIKTLIDRWDERVLLPAKSRLVAFTEETVREEPHWIVDFGARSYRLPKLDAVMLATDNITSEELARLLAKDLAREWAANLVGEKDELAKRLKTLNVTVEETRGQSASFVLENPLAQ